MLEQIRRPLALEKWIENFFRPTVIASMMACIVISVVALAHRVDPAWGGAYFVIFAFIVCWEAIQSERVLRHSAPGEFSRGRFRFTEAIVILLLLKLAGYTELGVGQLMVDVVRWFRNLGTFFDLGYIMSAVLIMILWQLSVFIAQDLYILEVHPSELRPSSTSTKFYLWLTRPRTSVNRTAALERIMVSFFWGGLILIVSTGLARYDIPYLFPDRPPPVSALVLNVMAYFLLGLVLISQGYYSVLRARWQLEEIPIAPRIGTHWAVLAGAFLFLVIVIALVLPTGYAVGLPQAIALAAHVVTTGIMYILVFVMGILIFIINAIAALILGNSAPVLDTPDIGPMAAPPASAERGPAPPIWGMLRDLLVWLLLFGIVAYSLYSFLGDRRQLLKGLLGRGILGRLAGLLARLFGGTRQVARQAGRLAREQLRRLFSAAARRRSWQYLSLSSLTPRQLILYFYLSIVRRATQRDIVRRPWQTPYEYGALLQAALPEQESEVRELTEAFVVARYSSQAVTPEEANLAKRTWRRVRGALRRWRLGL